MLHFVLDVLVAVPLFVRPNLFLSMVGLEESNVLLARIIAAALMGIGVESLLGRNAGRESYVGMLRMKIIWSGMVVLGFVVSLIGGQIAWSTVVGLVMGVFIFFNLVWVYWLLKLKK